MSLSPSQWCHLVPWFIVAVNCHLGDKPRGMCVEGRKTQPKYEMLHSMVSYSGWSKKERVSFPSAPRSPPLCSQAVSICLMLFEADTGRSLEAHGPAVERTKGLLQTRWKVKSNTVVLPSPHACHCTCEPTLTYVNTRMHAYIIYTDITHTHISHKPGSHTHHVCACVIGELFLGANLPVLPTSFPEAHSWESESGHLSIHV